MHQEKNSIIAHQKNFYNNITKIKKEELREIFIVQIDRIIEHVKQNVKIDCIQTHSIRRRNVEDVFEHLNKCM